MTCIVACLSLLAFTTDKSYAEQGCDFQETNSDWYEDECEDACQRHMIVHNLEEQDNSEDHNYAVCDGKFNVIQKPMFNRDSI